MRNTNESFSCRLCGSHDFFILASLDNFPKAAQFFVQNMDDVSDDYPITLNVIECVDCGLIQLKNTPVEYYKNVITAASLSEASKKRIIEEWDPIIKKYDLINKKAIEIGAGKGDFLIGLSNTPIELYGLENSEENLICAKEKKLNVIAGYLLDQNKLKKEYSLVISNNFLEHQPNVKLFISKMRELLIDDGILYLSVPNVEYLLKNDCLYEFVADHLVYFSEATLKKAMEINGFQVLEQYKKNNDNDLVVIARPRKITSLARSKKTVNDIIKSLKEIVIDYKNQNKNVVIWGAGHRALSLMALSELREIDFIIDSASFKQNMYSPILHKKIISPDGFIQLGCDLLIIMLPGSLSEQVINFLRSNKINCEVLVFKDMPLNKSEIFKLVEI